MRYLPDSRLRRHHPEGPESPQHDGRDDHDHDGPGRPHRRGGGRHSGPDREAGFGPAFGGPPFGEPGFPGGRRGGRGDRFGGRGRAQRGDVRAAVLALLAEQPMHGYQLMQAMAERTDGAWRPSPGAIYPTIAQLEDEGLVTLVAEGGRKLATLTDAGREALAATAPGDPFAAFSATPGQGRNMRSAFEEVAIAARLLTKNGTDAQVQAAQKVLNDARRSLYLILAEGTEEQSETPEL